MRISRLTLATSDLEGQASFYAERLGLPVDADADRIEVRLRHSTIRFEGADSGLDPRYHFAINLPAGSIEDAVEWLRGRAEPLAFHGDPDEEEGVTVVRTDVGAGCVYFLDPAGNVLELISNPHIDGDGGDFGPRSLIEIAEVGIATADPAATSAALRRFFGEDVYWGGGPGSLLTAVGDRRAVIITAPIDRGWIPVDLPARPLPTEIVAVGTDARELVLPEGPYRLRVESGSTAAA